MADAFDFFPPFFGKEDIEMDNLADLLQLDSGIAPLPEPELEDEAEAAGLEPFSADSPEAVPQPRSSVPAYDAVAIKSEDLASELDEDDAKQRRRRRSRNAKQQELNRLAQQRYRERKKAKYSEMQQSVDALASQLSQLQALRQENGALRGRAQQLETTIQQKDLQLRTHQEQLKQMQQILGRQVGTMREQQATIARQSAELAALQGRVDGSIDAALLSLDADTVSTKLSAAVKCALTGKELRGLHPTLGKIPDAVAQQISSTLTRCCAEMYQRLKQSGRAEPPPAIQVPCC